MKINQLRDKKVILVIAVILIVLIGILCSNSKSNKFIKMVEEGRLQKAEVYYENKLCKSDYQTRRAYEKAKKLMDEYFNKYNAGEVSYEDALQIISFFSTCWYEETEPVLDKLYELHDSKEAYEQGMDVLYWGKYYKAYDAFVQVIESDEYYSDAQEWLNYCSQRILENRLAESSVHAEDGYYNLAISIIQDGFYYLNESDQVIARETMQDYSILYAEQVKEKINVHWKNEEYNECFSVVAIAIDNVGSLEALVAVQDELIANYEEYVITTSTALRENNKYAEMALFLKDSINIFSDSTVINNQFEKWQKYLPIELETLLHESTRLDGVSRVENVMDQNGNLYEYAVEYWVSSVADGYAEYELGGKYTVFSTEITPSEEWKDLYGVCREITITILGDGNTLFEKTITKESGVTSIELNVTGIDELKIEFDRGKGYTSAHILFVNAYVYEEYAK